MMKNHNPTRTIFQVQSFVSEMGEAESKDFKDW